MEDSHANLLDILQIGHETSLRGAGLSMQEALARTHYKARRATFKARDLQVVLMAHPEICDAWLAYSEDKRTSGGWYLLPSHEIGRVGIPESRMHFATQVEAVSEYVVRELDFWVNLHQENRKASTPSRFRPTHHGCSFVDKFFHSRHQRASTMRARQRGADASPISTNLYESPLNLD